MDARRDHWRAGASPPAAASAAGRAHTLCVARAAAAPLLRDAAAAAPAGLELPKAGFAERLFSACTPLEQPEVGAQDRDPSARILSGRFKDFKLAHSGFGIQSRTGPRDLVVRSAQLHLVTRVTRGWLDLHAMQA
jgi:hypothetical protein